MRIKTGLPEILMAVCLCTALAACVTDSIQSNEVAKCTKVFILADDAMKREYERYVPTAMDWTYHFTELGFKEGNIEHVFRYDRNNYINRRKDDVKHKIVTLANYVDGCSESMKGADTIYLMIDNGETYSEFLVRERFDLVSNKKSIARHDISGGVEILVDFEMKQGQWSTQDTSMPRLVVRKTSEFDCHKIHQVTRFQAQDSTNESFVQGVGSMHRRTPKMDIRLKLINDLSIAAYLDQACE